MTRSKDEIGVIESPDQLEAHRERTWRRLLWFSGLVAAGWAVALVFHFYLMESLLGRDYPWNTFLYDPLRRFGDLVQSWRESQAPNPYLASTIAWFPFTYLVLSWAGGVPVQTLVVVYLAATFLAMAWIWSAWAREEGARWQGDPRWPAVAALGLAISLVNYPLLFAVDRGNLDPLITFALMAGVWSMWRGASVGGGLLLGLSAAPKIYTIAAAVLWVKRRRWFGAAVAVATLVALILVPASSFEGGLPATFRGMREGLTYFRDRYVLGAYSAHYSGDWLNAVRLVVLWTGSRPDMDRLVPAFQLVTVAWASLMTLHLLFFSVERWRELLAVVLIMLVFPNVMNDYKLVLLIPVVLAWLGSPSPGWRGVTFGVAAALLLIPKHYYFMMPYTDQERFSAYPPPTGDASISCLVTPVLLVALTATLWPTGDELAQARTRVRSAIDSLPWTRPTAG